MSLPIGRGILRECHRITRISPEQILGTERDRHIVLARHACMAALSARSGWSTSQLGRFFNRDHSTVLAALKVSARRAEDDAGYREMIDALLAAPGIGILERISLPEPEPEPEPALVEAAFVIEDEPLAGFKWDEGCWYAENRTTLDENGEAWEDRKFRQTMIKGSQRLAKVINLARAA